MSSLPAVLRPWAMQLSLFPEDLALSLGPHVARLAAAIGALRPRGETDGGEPQGYEGLTRRGPYERLLLTEWLYALESPDEFIRRAAFGEHAFLKPAFKQPQGSRRSVVLLDAGPDQLGAPRIAHLALLVVLQRRAEAAGAEFAWGVLQSSPDRGPFSAITAGTVQSWLAARSITPVTGEHVSRWREALALGSAPEDCWLVGSSRLARLPEAAGLSRVEVEERMAPGARALCVSVRRVARAPASVALELPPPEECVRLLREPFTARAATPVRLSNATRIQAFFFSADGTRLILIRADGSVAAQPIPHSPRSTVPKPRRFQPPADHRLVAVGWRRNGGLLVLTRDEKVLWIHGGVRGIGGSRPRGIPYLGYEGLLPDAPPPNRLPGLATSVLEDDRERVLARDSEGRLFVVSQQGPALLASRVSAFAEVRRKPAFVMTPTEGSSVEGMWLGLLEDNHQRHLPLGTGEDEAYFGHTASLGHADAGLLALRQRPGTWQVLVAHGHVRFDVRPEYRVVGVADSSQALEEPGLVLLASDRRTFMLQTPSRMQLLTRAAENVAHAAVSHGLPVLAWLTVKGELVVWSLQQGMALYRAAPEEAA
ncbi:LpqB family beta-propeller domain-containing protein [Hyalangium gracile]|uniref:LpqB family beta-propeller domain-containing protein n=1 Tax=Hyalangium gracile TaxID=394092 RepID=UPI001CCD46C9|nr:LpqB family beta-propeller domain-containing protein [Hyalangium gracile]